MKIFCIGYPRTGTTSVSRALGKLGYRDWHYEAKFYEQTVHALKTGEFPENIIQEYDSFADIPICIIYKKLDKLYPSSKFILITREKQSWFSSMGWMLAKMISKKRPNEHNELLWTNIYPEKIDEHTKDVVEYFSGNEDRLLVKDINEVNFSILAKFLNIDSSMANCETVPNPTGFVHLNKRGS